MLILLEMENHIFTDRAMPSTLCCCYHAASDMLFDRW